MLEKEIIDYWTRRAPSYSEINQKELCGRQKDLWTSYIMRRVQGGHAGENRDQSA